MLNQMLVEILVAVVSGQQATIPVDKPATVDLSGLGLGKVEIAFTGNIVIKKAA